MRGSDSSSRYHKFCYSDEAKLSCILLLESNRSWLNLFLGTDSNSRLADYVDWVMLLTQ